jgi:nucleotide-binding universal stress UspA family protein
MPAKEDSSMYRMILVPLDGSRQAEAILEHVIRLCGAQGARVMLLSVDEPPLMLERDEVIDVDRWRAEREARRREIEVYLDARRTELEQKGIGCDIRLADGPVAKTIIRAAEQVGADLVAMASHGLGSRAGTSYGSVAAGVLQHLDRPLLLIRCDPKVV